MARTPAPDPAPEPAADPAPAPSGDRAELPLIGWREWLALPDLGVARIKAKVDTGARTSALHAFELEEFQRHGRPWVRFEVHPLQRSARDAVAVEAPLHDRRRVKSSNGRTEERAIIVSRVELAGRCWPVELSLTRRDEMGFRMLLGREALRRRVLVDPGRSFLGDRRPRRRKRKDTP